MEEEEERTERQQGGVTLSTQGKQLTVYPNPTRNGAVTISLDDTTILDGDLSIFNAQGVLVKMKTLSEKEVNSSMEIEGLVPGLYFVVLHTAENELYNAKLMIY